MSRVALAVFCLFLSGAAGLVHEVVWIRRAALSFGSTTLALSTVLAVFFLGLALGSRVFGDLSVRLRRPIRSFAALEIAIALLAVASLPLFALAESLYGAVYRSNDGAGPLVGLARAGLVALVLVAPAMAMGGTLPLFCRQFVRTRAHVAAPTGRLYAVNTLGAAAGCLLAGFVLVPHLGLRASLLTGAALNLAAAGIALALSLPDAEPAPSARNGAVPGKRSVPWRIGLLFLGSGFVVLGFEVLWTRFLALLVRSTTTTYTITLAAVLLGIVLGSAVAARLGDRLRGLGTRFGWLQVLLGTTSLALMLLPRETWMPLGHSSLVYVAVLVPPSTLAGASFPIVMRMVVNEPACAGRDVGRMTALNTVGGVLGSLVTGFVLLPALGMHTTTLSLAGVAVAVGVVAFVLNGSATAAWRRVAACTVAVAAWALIPRISHTHLPDTHLGDPRELLAVTEGREGNLAVLEGERAKRLEIDRWWQGQDVKTHQVMAAHVPMLVHPAPSRVLVVGVGAGQTPARFLMYDIERLDCVDIEPAIFPLIDEHFDAEWMKDPRVRLITEDGRSYVRHGDATYDVVSLELGQIFRPGIASFYTADFYRQVRERLAPGGVVAQFVPLPFLTRETFASVVRTFLDVFPVSMLWYNTSELLIVGTTADELRIEKHRLELLETRGAVHDDLAWSHFGGEQRWLQRPEVFLAGFLVGADDLAALAGRGDLYRDDRPALAYAASGVTDSELHELPLVETIRQHLSPVSSVADVADLALSDSLVAETRAINLSDIEASALIRRYDRLRTRSNVEELGALIRRAVRANPENALAQRLHGELMIVLGRPEEALPRLRLAAAMRPDDAVARRALAYTLHRLRRMEEALPHYRAALEARPLDAECHNNFGAALAELGALEDARAHFTTAIRLSPAWREPRTNLARLMAQIEAGGGK